MLNANQLPNLKAELTTDPAGLGYGPYLSVRNDAQLVHLLNQSFGAYQVPITVIPSAQALAYLSLGDYLSLTDEQRAYLGLLAQAGNIYLTDPRNPTAPSQVLLSLQKLFPTATATGQTLAKSLTRAGSRAEYLFGPGTVIDLNDIAQALGG